MQTKASTFYNDLFAFACDMDYKPNSFPLALLYVCSVCTVYTLCLWFVTVCSRVSQCSQWAWWVCCLTPLSALACPYLCSLVSSPQLAPLCCSGLKSAAVPDKLVARYSGSLGFIFLTHCSRSRSEVKRTRDSEERGIDWRAEGKQSDFLAGWLWFHALCLCNRASGGGYVGLRRMDDPRGALGAGLPGTTPRKAGPALHHEQTVGKTVSCCSFYCGVINGALHVLWV